VYLKEISLRVETGVIWLRTGTSDGFSVIILTIDLWAYNQVQIFKAPYFMAPNGMNKGNISALLKPLTLCDRTTKW
jgi:hypothetical protein